jgi:hypothetical protein
MAVAPLGIPPRTMFNHGVMKWEYPDAAARHPSEEQALERVYFYHFIAAHTQRLRI